VAKIIEFYARDLFPRTIRKRGCRLGQVIEFPTSFKHSASMRLCEILQISTRRGALEPASPSARGQSQADIEASRSWNGFGLIEFLS
jgi:hypothetical protein